MVARSTAATRALVEVGPDVDDQSRDLARGHSTLTACVHLPDAHFSYPPVAQARDLPEKDLWAFSVAGSGHVGTGQVHLGWLGHRGHL